MSFLKSMFSDGAGNISMMRVTQFIVVIVILSVYIITNLKSTTGAQDFPANAVYVLLVVVAGKIIQNGTEFLSGIGLFQKKE
jgi:hypothetical protein